MNHDETSKILGPRYDKVVADGTLALDFLGLSRDAAILDVGTGGGGFAIFLAQQGFKVLTGEPADDATRYARQPWVENAERLGVRDRITFRAFDAGRMPFDSGTFDALFFFGVLHHIEETARRAAFREALRVTKPAGSVVYFEPLASLLDTIRERDPGHPPAADPSLYVGDCAVRAHRFRGSLMDIYIYGAAA